MARASDTCRSWRTPPRRRQSCSPRPRGAVPSHPTSGGATAGHGSAQSASSLACVWQVRAVPCGGRFHIQGRPQALPAACRQARSHAQPARARTRVAAGHCGHRWRHRWPTPARSARLLQLRACAASAEPRHGAGRGRRAGASQRPTADLRQRLQRDTCALHRSQVKPALMYTDIIAAFKAAATSGTQQRALIRLGSACADAARHSTVTRAGSARLGVTAVLSALGRRCACRSSCVRMTAYAHAVTSAVMC